MQEIWKAVPGYEGKYEVSNLGRVKSLARKFYCKNGITNQVRERILKPGTDGSGYFRCALCSDKKLTTFKVHRLVARAFVSGETKERFQVNHKDGNKKNNRSDNLEWATVSENCQHSFDIGLQKPKRGMLNGHSKLKDSDIPKIRKMFESGMTSRQIASFYKMDKTIFLDIKNGKCWSHV